MKNLKGVKIEGRQKSGIFHYCPFVLCFIGGAMGIVFNSYCPIPSGIYCIFITIGFLALCFRFAGKTSSYEDIENNTFEVWSIIVLSFLLFGLNHEFHHNSIMEDDISRWCSEKSFPLIAEGWIAQLPICQLPRLAYLGENIPQTKRTTTELILKRMLRNGGWKSCSGKVIIRFSGDLTELRIGDLVRIKGSFSLILPPSNRYEFNRYADLLGNGIRCKVQVEDFRAIQLLQPRDSFPVLRFFEKLRRAARTVYQKYLSEVNASFASAIVFGLRGDFDTEIIENFKQTGTVHILAISGLHLAIICGILFFILNLFKIPPIPAALFLMAATVFYAMAAGLQPPILRSAIMVLVFCLRNLVHRLGDGINTLVFAALILLMINPDEIFQFGTQFSFMAVGVFLYFPQNIAFQYTFSEFYCEFKKQMRRWRRYRRYIPKGKNEKLDQYLSLGWYRVRKIFFRVSQVQFFLVPLTIWLVMVPLIIHNTSLITPISIIINPLIVFPLSLVLYLSLFLVLIAGEIPFLASGTGFLTDKVFDFLQWGIDWGHLAPGGYYYVAQLPNWWCLVFYLPLISITILPQLRYYKKRVLIFLFCWSLLGIFLPFIESQINQRRNLFQANIFSVGHGAAFLLTFPDGRTVLLDCGSFTSPWRVGNLIKQTLWNKNIKKIDLLILSHADSDHYNAVDSIINNFTVGCALVSDLMFRKENLYVQRLHLLLSDQNIPTYSVNNQTNLHGFGFPELSILHPSQIIPEETSPRMSNEYCLVVRVDFSGKSILFPGDLEDNTTPFLNNKSSKIDVLLAPHHGGKVERYQALLNWARPDNIIISGGTFQNNASEESKLHQKGYHVFNTQRNGEIIIRIEHPHNNSFINEKIESKIEIIPFKK